MGVGSTIINFMLNDLAMDNYAQIVYFSPFLRDEINMINRKRLKSLYHESYERHPSLKDYECFYCGMSAETEDHIPPLSLIETFPSYDRILVRSCRSCNGLLGSRPLLSPSTRVEYLIKRYQRRWRKDIDMPNWTDWEIEELSGRLKRQIIIGIKRKERAKLVMDYLYHRREKLENE